MGYLIDQLSGAIMSHKVDDWSIGKTTCPQSVLSQASYGKGPDYFL